jgi:hypothetical protein
MPSAFKLGKTPARPDAVKLKFSDFVAVPKRLPPLKTRVGWPSRLPKTLGVLGNDNAGDCVWAGAAHETMLWNELGSNTSVPFTDQAVLSDYTAVTGYDPADPNTDQGTDMQVAASYRRKTGIIDANGNRHKVAAYLGISTVHELKYAIYLFNAVGIGIRFPASAMDQFNNGQPWTVVPSAPIEGGHYIPAVYADSSGFQIITWGKKIRATTGFISTYMDEAIAYVSDEALHGGVSYDGFKRQDLLDALQQLPRT